MARCDDCKANKVCDHNRFGFENCGNFIPADVAPRAEVAREIFGEIESNMHRSFDELPDEPTLEISMEVFAELKKKYLYRCPECKHFVGFECFSGQTCDQYEEGSSNTKEEQPTDVVDVVRCKDCFYNKNDSCIMSENLNQENYDPNFFCGSGYREDGNGSNR